MTNTQPTFTELQLQQCKHIHFALIAKANENRMGLLEWIEEIGIDGLYHEANKISEEIGLDANVWRRWANDPDAQAEFDMNMGGDIPLEADC